MKREEIKDQVLWLISKQNIFDGSIEESDHLRDDLGMDSLDEVECLMEIEKHFGILFTDDEAASIKTVGQAIDMVVKKEPKNVQI